MGYTHYWTQDVKATDEQFSKFTDDFKTIVSDSDLLQREYDNNDPVDINNDFVAFNGIGDEGHETMFFENGGLDFNFCKTARKPYDTHVTAALILLKHHLTDDIHISSDGNTEDWQPAMDLINEKLGTEHGIKFKITNNGKLNLWHSSKSIDSPTPK